MSTTADLNARHHDALDREGQGWMAAAGAAIGFALHEASGSGWNWPLALTAAAIAIWCGSFAAGIFRLAAHRNSLQANLILSLLRDARATDIDLKPFVARHDARAARQVAWRGWQLWLLFAGAVTYLGAASLGAWDRAHGPAAMRCLYLQEDMLSGRPWRKDGIELFRALGCHAAGEKMAEKPAGAALERALGAG